MSWKFYNPVSILCAAGSRSSLSDLLRNKDVLVVCSKRGRLQFTSDNLLNCILQNNKVTFLDSVQENPSLSFIEQERVALSAKSFSAIVAFGGGSALDTGKLLKACMSVQSNYSLSDLINNPSLCCKQYSLPLYTIPTTSGSGSEVTPFATCWDYISKKKYSLSSDTLWPHLTIVDPELSYTLPLNVTVSTGLDAVCQALESVWNKNANPVTIGYATQSLRRSLEALPILINALDNTHVRVLMSEASLLAGLAISHTRTALCHSISYPLTSIYGVPHGIACAFTMVSVLKHNLSYDDGRLALLASSINYSVDDLINSLRQITLASSVTKIVQDSVGSLNNLIALEDQMITVGRADNNLAPIHNLREILISSWNQID